jgi:transposase
LGLRLAGLNSKIADLDKEIARRAREDEVSRRLMTVLGIGPISATAIAALASPVATFAQGPRLCRLLGLTSLQRSTGGKQKLGATSKMGERTLRRLLIIGSSAVVQQASTRGAPKGSWLEQMLAPKPCAGNCRAREQDGADRMGATYKAGELQGSGRGQGVILAGLRSSEV